MYKYLILLTLVCSSFGMSFPKRYIMHIPQPQSGMNSIHFKLSENTEWMLSGGMTFPTKFILQSTIDTLDTTVIDIDGSGLLDFDFCHNDSTVWYVTNLNQLWYADVSSKTGTHKNLTKVGSIAGSSALKKVGLFPNPVRSTVTLSYEVPYPSILDAKIIDVSGKTVRDIFSGSQQTGSYTYIWDGMDNAGAGVANAEYYFRVGIVGGSQVLNRLILLR